MRANCTMNNALIKIWFVFSGYGLALLYSLLPGSLVHHNRSSTPNSLTRQSRVMSHAIGNVALRNLSSGEAPLLVRASVSRRELTDRRKWRHIHQQSSRAGLRAGATNCVSVLRGLFANCNGSTVQSSEPCNARSAFRYRVPGNPPSSRGN